MIPVIGVVGYSNSGKTTLLEKMIKEFTRRGVRVGTIKHHHREMVMDKPGKDTWRHAEAGAKVTLLATPKAIAKYMYVEEELPLEQVVKEIEGVDIILVEGFKFAKIPKIEVFRTSIHNSLITPKEDLIAVAADRNFEGVPCYNLEDIVGLCNLIQDTYL